MSLLNDDAPQGAEQPPPQKKSALAGILPYTSVALVLALLYVAWVFYSRHERSQEAAAVIEKERQDAEKKQANMIFGSGEVKFLTFSASPGHLKSGESARLCYGMVNAEKVKIEPSIGEDVKPTSRHCADISPKSTTTYTITASNAKGETKSTSLTVQVN